MTTIPSIQPGWIALHGNRLEWLRDAVLAWLAAHPLAPLEEEVFLVQSNGMAEWLKRGLAEHTGVCAATRVELPARFLWRSYRAVLGAVPTRSPLDKGPMTWRLMRCLGTEMLEEPAFDALRAFLRVDDETPLTTDPGLRRFQLAERLADLYDQYQIYRPDWLRAWLAGNDEAGGEVVLDGGLPCPPDQRWQVLLWRRLVAELDPEGPNGRQALRPEVHARFLQRSQLQPLSHLPQLPRRVVLFGVSHLPLQVIEALAALAGSVQVVLALPNPCQYHWADIIEGRELLAHVRRQQRQRPGFDPAALSLEAAHAQSHPLLAAWGRQGRDFIRLLDAFEERHGVLPRVDLFDADLPTRLLGQVQAALRDLLPLAEHAERMAMVETDIDVEVEVDDDSIVFHICHSPQREVEVLHDALLRLFKAGEGDPTGLRPRDVVVMVPDIAPYVPVIRAVFGQYRSAPRPDPRFIPFEIADLGAHGEPPMLLALTWLLRQPQRHSVSEIEDLLDVAPLAARFGIPAEERPLLGRWLRQAGVRWGLSAPQREQLGLDACGAINTWLFGLQRMLLGYASGASPAFAGIEPYADVAGLDAALAGALAELIQALIDWSTLAAQAAAPSVWAERARALVRAFFAPQDEAERLLVVALDESLERWLQACDEAGFTELISVAVLRSAWLGGLHPPDLGQRFIGGGVTFCTLMPMRAIPFEMVCLLGMNEGDYPRRAPASDFDLMALAGQRRAGDRARRDDDRTLMLEALLAARRTLYLSWVGRSPRDQSAQPPSVLVAQLRDYLAAGWSPERVERLTHEHPMQPFSRRYFEAHVGPPFETYAREWRSAHEDDAAPHSLPQPPAQSLATLPAGANAVLELSMLSRFLSHPARSYFRHRLGVDLGWEDEDDLDQEPFPVDGRDGAKRMRLLWATEPLASLAAWPVEEDERRLRQAMHDSASALVRSGVLPLAGLGEHLRCQLIEDATPMLLTWRQLCQRWSVAAPKQLLHAVFEGERGGQVGVQVLEDWLDGLHLDPHQPPDQPLYQPDERVMLERLPKRLAGKPTKAAPLGSPRVEVLIGVWVRMLAAAAQGLALRSVLVGRDVWLDAAPLGAEQAQEALHALVEAWTVSQTEPLPLPLRTAVAALRQADPEALDVDKLRAVYDEERDAYWLRCYPELDDVLLGLRRQPWAQRLLAPLLAWIEGSVVVHAHAHAQDPDQELLS
ncbi:MAG: exodeoxyribonuclease V subunit gamma [Leptothrix ochracea]|uniref:exodeoxyribonuclease V subunit gamma n=1 Tax=Leptothrix ochracea TaxID=735331 RepID=UPI0034E2A339